MSSNLKDKGITNDRPLAVTRRTTNEEAAGRTNDVKSTSSQMSKTDSGSLLTERERRKKEHNEIEQRRKERIKQCIYRMGDLLPPFHLTDRDRPSTVEIVEKSLAFMREWKESSAAATVEIARLKDELATVKEERDMLMEVARDAGKQKSLVSPSGTIQANVSQAATEDAGLDPLSEARSTNGVSSTTDAKIESPKIKSKKSKRRNNTLSAHLQARRDIENQQQEMITSSVSMSDDQQINVTSNEMMNLPGGQFMPGQNMMLNPMMMPGGQLLMPGMINGMIANNQGMLGNQGLVGNNQGLLASQQALLANSQNEVNLMGAGANKTSSDDSEAGLLQLAMQDAGITPQSSSQTSQSEEGGAVSTSAAMGAEEVGDQTSNMSQTSALQTLASVATNTQGLSVRSESVGSQGAASTDTQSSLPMTNPSAAPSVSTSLPVRTSGPTGYQPMVHNGQVINMPLMGNQPMLQSQQQVMFINEQGIPVIANMPVGIDPNSQGNQLLNNIQKQNVGLDQNAMALAQQQSNLAAVQGQIIGQNGQNLQNMALQQQNILPGGILQNGQFLQQLGGQGQLAQVQGQNQVMNLQGQGGMVLGGPPGVLPGNQGGNLVTVNPNQQNQLPSALLLPNGQIVPVVTNPGNVFSQAGPAQMSNAGNIVQNRMTAPQFQAQLQGPDYPGGQNQLIVGHLPGQGSQGLLMPVTSAGQLASSGGASLTTSVVPTSAIQSVMTTQLQGSSLSEKSVAMTTPRTDGGIPASSNVTPTIKTSQPLLTGSGAFLMSTNSTATSGIPGHPGGGPPPNAGFGMPGSGKGGAPILISLPINGQLTSVLVDPVTMQVLGTVQQPPQAPGPGAPQLVPAPGLPPASQAPQISGAPTSTANSSAPSKNKKKGNQRTIVPKPSAAGEPVKTVSVTSKKKSSKAAKVVELAQPDSLSDGLQIQIPESTTEPDTSTHTTEASPSSTDILAKAAESIFSASMSELTTPVGGFYNPANEDNPLHIDTSAADVDEETNKSPEKKQGTDSKIGSAKQAENLQKPAAVLDAPKTTGADNLVSEADVTSLSADVTSLSATLEDIADMKFAEEQAELEINVNRNKDMNCANIFIPENKEDKINTTINAGINISKPELKETGSDLKDLCKQSGQNKKGVSKKGKAKNSEMMDTFDDTLHVFHIPEAASFSEDLNDVLDQVEHFGGVNVNSPSRVNKKSKSKRSKPADSEGEPSVKKRKAAQKDKNIVANEALLSMPTVLSVYDFDGTDDIVPQLLPLNAKEFRTMSSGKGVTNKDEQMLQETNTNVTIKSVVNTKINKTSAQPKADKPPANQSKNSKSAKNSKEMPIPCAQPSTDQQFLYIPETLPADKSLDLGSKHPANEKQDNSSKDPVKLEKEILPNMPDIDTTTTSLFGFPVVRKPQNVTQKSSPNKVTSRETEQPSAKASPVTSKQNIKLSPAAPNKDIQISPKTVSQISPNLSNLVSPPQVSNVSVSVNSCQSSVVINSSALMSPASLSMKDSVASQNINSNISESLNTKLAQKQSQSVITSVSTSAKTENLLNTVGNNSKDIPVQAVNIESNKKPNVVSAKVIETLEDIDLTSKLPKESVTDNVKDINNLSKFEKDPRDRSRDTHVASVNYSSQNVSANNLTESSKAVTTDASEVNETLNAKLTSSGEYTEMSFGEIIPPHSSGGKVNGDSDSSLVNTNFSSSYTSGTVFSSPSKSSASVVKSPPNVTVSLNGKISHKSDTASVVKGRSNIYSADNFVHSGRENSLRPKNAEMSGQGDSLMNSNEIGSGSFSRLQNESSSDGFNFANIGLNIAPITTTAPSSSYMDLTVPVNSSAVTSSTTSASFSFSLSSSSGAVTTTTSSVLGQHQFPFYPPMLSSAGSAQPETESTQGNQTMANANMFNGNNVMQRNNAMQRRDTNRMPRSDTTSLQRGDSTNMPRGDSNISRSDSLQMNRNNTSNMQTMREDNSQGPGADVIAHRMDETNKPSCSKQAKLSKGQNSNHGNIPDLYPFSNAHPAAHDQNYYRNPHMKSNVGKSPPEQMHKPPDKVMSEMVPPQSRPSNPNSQDKRSGPLDRSPQLMNQGPPYFTPQNYPPAKSLNTPPLHHPPMMEDRGRNMTNRSPYESSGPPSSQGFSTLPHSYLGNRFDVGGASFSRDNSGTQPLSHTPINTGGRKSANPPQQKQAAPPLVSMPPQSRPAPPQPSHRPTPPLVTPPQAPTPSQVSNPSRPKQTASRSSKSKKSKQHPFVEVDSNLSNSIFENNRSMTPFFPVQNLSPQSRAMPHDGSPFLPGNFFGPGPRLPNTNTPLPKNSEIGSPFNQLFQPGRAQNGLGLNFQPGFGMNMNPLHGNHGNGPQITPHTGVASHMANFNLNNIFSDVNSSQSESLNISPIKFGHANSMLQHQAGMDPGAMQHHHQNYRGHPPPPPSVLSMNSILGPNHHGFDGRSLGQMNTSMAPPFHSHGHPPFIPPLNFSMHDH